MRHRLDRRRRPATLRWRYYVKLDPAEIPKAMWAEVSPDGRCSGRRPGNDLLAYRIADITPPTPRRRPPLRAVRRLRGAVPPTGITGAAFYGDRLLLAGQRDIDLRGLVDRPRPPASDGWRSERGAIGESEGLDVSEGLGGVLHWIITPFDPLGRPPTLRLGRERAAALHAARTRRPKLRLTVEAIPARPADHAAVHRHHRRRTGRRRRRAGRRTDWVLTDARGRATPDARRPPAGRITVTASRADLRAATAQLRAGARGSARRA